MIINLSGGDHDECHLQKLVWMQLFQNWNQQTPFKIKRPHEFLKKLCKAASKMASNDPQWLVVMCYIVLLHTEKVDLCNQRSIVMIVVYVFWG